MSASALVIHPEKPVMPKKLRIRSMSEAMATMIEPMTESEMANSTMARIVAAMAAANPELNATLSVPPPPEQAA